MVFIGSLPKIKLVVFVRLFMGLFVRCLWDFNGSSCYFIGLFNSAYGDSKVWDCVRCFYCLGRDNDLQDISEITLEYFRHR